MRDIILFTIVFMAFPVSAWECEKYFMDGDIKEIFNRKKYVFVGQVTSGKMFENKDIYFEYTLEVEDNIKGATRKILEIKGDNTLQLTIGESYIFYLTH